MYLHEELSRKIISACYSTHNELGTGFLEKVYQEALAIMLDELGIPYEQEKHLPITFRGKTLKSTYIADFVIDNKIILETKATKELESTHEAQVLNYLRATGFHIGLLVNFGQKRLQIKRLAANIY